MKSLVSIIKKLSPNEINTFRSFLTTHSRTGKNKKLELFDQLVRTTDVTPFNSSATSRQSTYQLKKRLQDELYSFLTLQDQQRNGDDQLFREMDCHRKLYCFKILYDKGIRDHASQVLQEVIDVSSEHGLHGLYLEAINLRNNHFPVKKDVKRKIPIRYQLRKLKKALGRNLYINQYLTESAKIFFDNDGSFRLTLINELVYFDLSATEHVIEQLMDVNHLIHQREFLSAQDKLVRLSEAELGDDDKLRGLILIDLAKVTLCLGNIARTAELIANVREFVGRYGSFFTVFLELNFFIHVRNGDFSQLSRIVNEARQNKEIRESDVLRGKWACYSLYMSFLLGRYREVIKIVNGDPVFAFRNRSWLINIKFLELVCILKTGDVDWLFYKIESLRKLISTLTEKPERVMRLLALIKAFASGQGSFAVIREKIVSLEREYPWHPFGIEVINYTQVLLELSKEAPPPPQPKPLVAVIEE